MQASELYRFGSPSKHGRLNTRDWVALEKASGPLPHDFKDLISSFGLGSFGDLTLFHPHHKNPMFRLGTACEIGEKILRSQGDPVINQVIADYPLILGYLGPRRYLLHGNDCWLSVESETMDIEEIGPDMVKFFSSAFADLTKGRVSHSLAPAIWKTAQDGTISPFFRAVR